MNTDYGIEDISIPEYSAKVKLQAAARRRIALIEALNKAHTEFCDLQSTLVDQGLSWDQIGEIIEAA